MRPRSSRTRRKSRKAWWSRAKRSSAPRRSQNSARANPVRVRSDGRACRRARSGSRRLCGWRPMHVVELWRHPVKSLQGEPLAEAAIEDSGLLGDRKWGLVDVETGMVLTARRVPSLLLASARLTSTGVEIAFPDGEVLTAP